MFGSSSFSNQQQPATSLFGSTVTPGTGGGIFGQQQTPQQQTTGNLFGSVTTSTGLFGSTQQTQPTPLFGSQGQSNPTPGGLFGASAGNPINNQPPTGSLFGSSTQPTQQSGGLFGQAQPATIGSIGANSTASQTLAPSPFGTSASSASSGGLFGASSGAQNSTTGGTSGLFGSAATTGTSSSLFGNQPAAASATSGGLFGTSVPSSTTNQTPGNSLFGASTTAQSSGPGLFGSTTTGATPPQSTSTSLFAPASGSSTTQPAGNGLFGLSGTTTVPATTSSLFGSNTTNNPTNGPAGTAATGLFGAPGISTVATVPSSSIFGSGGTSGTGNSNGTSATPVTQTSASLAQAKANLLEHRPIEEVLANWENRISQQASIFQKFASDVVSVDKQLIQSAQRLKELSDEHSVIKQKSGHIDSAIKSIWDHQDALGKLLSHIQEEINKDRSTGVAQYPGAAMSGTGSASERGSALWSQILDMETEVNDIVRDIESINSGTVNSDESCQGNLSGLVKLIKLHAHSIATLQQQTNDARKTLQSI